MCRISLQIPREDTIVKKLILMMILTLTLTACGQGGSQSASQGQTASGSSELKEVKESEEEPQKEEAPEPVKEEGNKEDTEKESADQGPTLKEVYDKIQASVELNSPMEVPDQFLENTYGIDINTLDDHFVSVSEAAISAETIALMRVEDSNAFAAAKDALNVLLEEKAMEMENYLPEQYEIVKKAEVKEKGSFLYLIISENSDAITKIVEENIG